MINKNEIFYVLIKVSLTILILCLSGTCEDITRSNLDSVIFKKIFSINNMEYSYKLVSSNFQEYRDGIIYKCSKNGRLVNLSISGKWIKVLPEELGLLDSLEVLSFRYSPNLKQLPVSIGNLKNLKVLVISRVSIDSIPKSYFSILKLETLFLTDLKIKKIPSEIGSLKNLTELTIMNCLADSLPDALCNLEKLNILHIVNNKNLKKLPDSIGKIINLVEAAFWENSLDVLPKSISNLDNLKYLHLADNCFTELPDYLFKLKNLKYVYVNGNSLCSVEPETSKWIDAHSRFDGVNRRDGISATLQDLDSNWREKQKCME